MRRLRRLFTSDIIICCYQTVDIGATRSLITKLHNTRCFFCSSLVRTSTCSYYTHSYLNPFLPILSATCSLSFYPCILCSALIVDLSCSCPLESFCLRFCRNVIDFGIVVEVSFLFAHTVWHSKVRANILRRQHYRILC